MTHAEWFTCETKHLCGLFLEKLILIKVAQCGPITLYTAACISSHPPPVENIIFEMNI